MAHWVINCLYFFYRGFFFFKSAAYNYKTVIRETFMKPALTSIRYKIIIFLTLFGVDLRLGLGKQKIIKNNQSRRKRFKSSDIRVGS